MVHQIERRAVIIEEEISRGYVSHGYAEDGSGQGFLCIGKADDANPNLRWVDVYKRPTATSPFDPTPIDRLDPTYKIDAVDADVSGDGHDLVVTVTTHAPQEAPRPTAVEEIIVLGCCTPRAVGQHPGACVAPGNRPYFLPNNPVTRGQDCKIIALALKLPLPDDGRQTFEDIPPSSPFYPYIEAVHEAEAINGYPCV